MEISHYQGVEKPTITRTFASLEEMSYVEQVAGRDKREKRMQLTGQGTAVYEEVRVTIDQFEKEILKDISESELIDFIRVMEEIKNNIKK